MTLVLSLVCRVDEPFRSRRRFSMRRVTFYVNFVELLALSLSRNIVSESVTYLSRRWEKIVLPPPLDPGPAFSPPSPPAPSTAKTFCHTHNLRPPRRKPEELLYAIFATM